ncbi:carbon-nitrogen hydrolase family protein [Agromyces albus]|uniref:carbon-nitrogen hydrolase family protein n=1 Tax=Agromyces albus TaxID=205332 RepID=UPI00277DF66E|nr:carbon-nitrogen hydrolase family protein [Agromyces albus]MDQ0577264.1 putative amidohydrolase [Agromyces albus]
MIRVGACQTPEIIGSVDDALACIRRLAALAATDDVDLVLFPECFLQGYLVERAHVEGSAMGLDSPEFAEVLRRLRDVSPTLVFGIIERDRQRILNTAVVVREGELLGAYRKTHLTAGESLFDAGREYPTFDLRGVRFGINICHDANFSEPANRVAAGGADVLLLPAQNMMRRSNAELWKDEHSVVRARRARETGMWLVSSDVTGARDAERVGWGPTSVINPRGEVVAQVPQMEVGLVTADVPARPFREHVVAR